MRTTKIVLVVDDEAHIREVVTYALRKEGYDVLEAKSGAEGLSRISAGQVDLVVLDVMLPDIDGLEVLRRVRVGSAMRLPVLFLSARGEEVDRIVGLEVGGDDYLVKPFSPRELVARVRALFRRAEPGAATAATPNRDVVRHGDVIIDVDRHEVRVKGQLVQLTPTEFGLLSALLERPGVVLSRGQLMQRAYRYDNLITERTIDTHVRRVRSKLRPLDVDPIETVHGIGYRARD